MRSEPLAVDAAGAGVRAFPERIESPPSRARIVLVNEDKSKVVEDLVPKVLPLAVVHTIPQNLLRERVSISDAVSILEALGEAAAITKNTVLVSESVRQAIRRQVVKRSLEPSGDLSAYDLEQASSDLLLDLMVAA